MVHVAPFWDKYPEYEHELRKLAAEDLTSKEIAAQMKEKFKYPFTKNSIVSRARRQEINLNSQAKVKKAGERISKALRLWAEKNPDKVIARAAALKITLANKRKNAA